MATFAGCVVIWCVVFGNGCCIGLIVCFFWWVRVSWGACVMFNEILNRTNEAGREFAQKWLQNCTLLGIEPSHDSREQFFVVYINGEGLRAVLCLPDAGTSCAPCYYGSLEYYADAVARAFVRSCGAENYVGLRYLPDDQKRGAAVAKYSEVVNKYGGMRM